MGIFAGHINHPAYKGAEYNADNHDNRGNHDVRQSAGYARGVFRELSYTDEVQPERKKGNDEHPEGQAADYGRGLRFHPTSFKEGDYAETGCPLVKAEKDEDFLDQFSQKPAYNEACDHHNKHHNDIQEDFGKILVQIEKHVAEEGFHGEHLIKIAFYCQRKQLLFAIDFAPFFT
jgi:hypothetical protein